jgi:class 3 adenylate cyclase/tetratricopeptide (TPR) repeat protein
MRCGKCGKDNREGRRFCAQCGAALAVRCARCGASNEPDEKFCGDCGAALGASNPITPAANAQAPGPGGLAAAISVTVEPAASEIPDGERKTVTALFADIKGSTELMADLDPEEARVIIDPALRLMIDAVHRYDGYIVQSTGDGIFALFGAPVAHEDHPQRALYAALRMQEEMGRYADRLRASGQPTIQARVGVNTGEAVLRPLQTGAGQIEYAPIGHATNLAARMQTLAPIGSIAVTAQTQRLCEGYFTFKSLGPTAVKGVSEPVTVFELKGLSPLRTRLQLAARRGLCRFVGRDAELAQMKRALDLGRNGHGQIVAVIGEAGAGKSRLLHEFKAVSQGGALLSEAYCVSHGQASAYLPVIELLKGYFGITNEDDPRKRREKVAGKIVILDGTLEDTLPYVYALLGIVEPGDPLSQMDPQIRRQRTQEDLKRIFVRESLNQPLILVFEDLHWIDAETQGLLNMLADALVSARILMLVNYRPEYHHDWGNRAHYTQLRLDPLGPENAAEMLSALLGDALELGPIKQEVAERSQGNPFFIEELVQALFDQGVLVRNGEVKVARPLSQVHVPPTVQGVLASRIDRLAPREKELLQTLAVIGREFPLGLVRQVTQHPHRRVTALAEKGTSAAPLALSRNEADQRQEELERTLADLQLAEFIYEQPTTGDIEYTFKHALTQEVAYNSILVERRKQIHERAAEAIESLFASSLSDHYDELAHHFRRSANGSKAVQYLHLAARQAMHRSAYAEASGQLTAALELVRTQPDDLERARTEIAVRLSLADCGWGSVDGLEVSLDMLERARELCEKVGNDASHFEVLALLAFLYSVRLDHQKARPLLEELSTIAMRMADPEIIGRARLWLGYFSMYEGNLFSAMEEFDRVDMLSASVSSKRDVAMMNWRIQNRSFASWTLWALGYPERAMARSKESFAVAREVSGSAGDLALALWWSANLNLGLRDWKTAYLHADEAAKLARDHDVVSMLASIGWQRGWALAQLGHSEEGLGEILRCRTELIQTARTVITLWLFEALADVYLAAGRPREGLEAVREGLERIQGSGSGFIESAMRRLKGELLLIGNNSALAEAAQCFRDAIEVARRQGAKSYELRATMSLARLLAKQDKRDEARAMLAEIYSWFTEGFDTADLKDAKVLLEELSH